MKFPKTTQWTHMNWWKRLWSLLWRNSRQSKILNVFHGFSLFVRVICVRFFILHLFYCAKIYLNRAFCFFFSLFISSFLVSFCFSYHSTFVTESTQRTPCLIIFCCPRKQFSYFSVAAVVFIRTQKCRNKHDVYIIREEESSKKWHETIPKICFCYFRK